MGSAIIEIMNAPDKSVYKEVVLWGCLHDIAYDTQVEGTKADYLYSAISQFDDPAFFLDAIIAKFKKKNYHRLSSQLEDLLWRYALDGNADAKNTIQDKINELSQRLPKQRQYAVLYHERELLESLMISLVRNSGFRAFKKNVGIMGRMIKQHGSDGCIWYDWLMDCANDQFGKDRINAYFDKELEKQTDAAIFVAAYRQSKIKDTQIAKEREKAEQLTSKMAAEELYELAQDVSKDIYPRYVFRNFVRKASEDDLTELAKIAVGETDATVKELCLLPFRRIDFPLDISYLIDSAESDNETLADISIEALSRFKDDRVHELAIKLLHDGNENAFELLKNNFRRNDADLIRKSVTKMKTISHHAQMSLRDMLRHYKSPVNRDTLLHVYQNGDCSFCRSDIVETMHQSGCLTDEILQECRYDSYAETRRFAERIYKKRLSKQNKEVNT